MGDDLNFITCEVSSCTKCRGGVPALPSIYGKRQVTAFALAGDRYHSLDYVRTALGKTFVHDLGITIDFTDE